MVKNLPASAGDLRDAGSIPRSGRSPGGGHGYPLQDPCLENPMDGGPSWATVHGVIESRTRLKRLSVHAHNTSGLDTRIQFKMLLQVPTDEAYGKVL